MGAQTQLETGWTVLAPVVGILVLAFTFLFSIMYWADSIIAAMESAPELYYYAFFALWLLASLGGVLFGGEVARSLGGVGLAMMGFSIGMTAAFELPEYLVPLIEPMIPTWPPTYWVMLGVGLSTTLIGAGWVQQKRDSK